MNVVTRVACPAPGLATHSEINNGIMEQQLSSFLLSCCTIGRTLHHTRAHSLLLDLIIKRDMAMAQDIATKFQLEKTTNIWITKFWRLQLFPIWPPALLLLLRSLP